MDEMLDVKMPPPQPEPELEVREIEEQEEQIEEQIEEEEPKRQHLPDEEVFKEVPQIKKVKRKPSEKQLAHLKKMREKKEANKRQKEEWLAEQREKQSKFVKQETKQTRATRAKPPISKQKVEYIDEPDIQHYDAGGGGRGEPINQYYANEIEQPTAPPPARREQVGMYQLSPDQIRQLQRDAIADYETIRIDRVKQQRQALQKQREQEALTRQRQQVFGQMTSSAQADDPWASAFNFN